jgi:hypothetical protein
MYLTTQEQCDRWYVRITGDNRRHESRTHLCNFLHLGPWAPWAFESWMPQDVTGTTGGGWLSDAEQQAELSGPVTLLARAIAAKGMPESQKQRCSLLALMTWRAFQGMSNNNAHMPHMLLKNTCAIMICWFDTYHRSKEAHVNTMAVAIPWLIFWKASKGLERNDVGRCFKECFREISLQFRFFKEMEFGMISHLVEHGRSMLLLNKKKESRHWNPVWHSLNIMCISCAPKKETLERYQSCLSNLESGSPICLSRCCLAWRFLDPANCKQNFRRISKRFQSLPIAWYLESLWESDIPKVPTSHKGEHKHEGYNVQNCDHEFRSGRT